MEQAMNEMTVDCSQDLTTLALDGCCKEQVAKYIRRCKVFIAAHQAGGVRVPISCPTCKKSVKVTFTDTIAK